MTTFKKTLRQSLAVVAAGAVLLASNHAAAQIFGARTLGRPLNARSPGGPSQEGTANSVFGMTALERAARSGGDFVGRDPRERSTFVGRVEGAVSQSFSAASQQLRQSRAQEIVRRRSQNANLLQIQRGADSNLPIYAPRLAAELSDQPDTTIAYERRIEAATRQLLVGHGWKAIRVTVRDGEATLRGSVPSDYERSLAESMLAFEPGVDRVVNELKVVKPAARN
ncbi:MAG: BON domain-containing protein [Planctomycetales bacterium]|nr:BON domain-containing protein [Planctomycetales bacterium]